MLELNHITIGFGAKACIYDAHLTARHGEITVIAGESGTGKTSLLNVIALLDSNHTCEYRMDGITVSWDQKSREQFHHEHIAYITQHSMLLRNHSVRANIDFHNDTSMDEEAINELLKTAGLSDMQEQLVHRLSGGERQRLALVCALLQGREILLGDEISASLDEANKQYVLAVLQRCCDMGKIIILASHDPLLIERADHLYVLQHQMINEERVSQKGEEKQHETTAIAKRSAKQLFQCLMAGSKKNIVLFIVMAILLGTIGFMTMQVADQNLSRIDTTEGYSLQMISDCKIDITLPVGTDIEHLDNIPHLTSLYPKYSFEDSTVSANGYWNETMQIKVEDPDGNIKTPEELSTEMKIAGYSDNFIVIPYFEEESWYHDSSDGVYVNENIAYRYDIETGDILSLKVAVPYASGQYVSPSSGIYQFAAMVDVRAKVVGITSYQRSFIEKDNVILMPYERMRELIRQEKQHYEDGEYTINTMTMEGYSKLIPLTTVQYTGFVDQYENVPQVMNEIQDQNDDVTVQFDYIDRLQTNEHLQSYRNTYLSILIGTFVLTLVTILMLEWMYVRLWRKEYLYLRYQCIAASTRHSIGWRKALLQFMGTMMSAIILYGLGLLASALFPSHPIDQTSLQTAILTWLRFSWQHLLLYATLMSICIFMVNQLMIYRWDRVDLLRWLRDDHDPA